MPDFRIDNSGLTRDEVRRIRAALAAAGIDPGPIDGLLGPRTSAAIIAFKRSLGFVGQLTWDALMDAEEGVSSPVLPLDLPPWLREGLRVKGWQERGENAPLKSWLASDGYG